MEKKIIVELTKTEAQWTRALIKEKILEYHFQITDNPDKPMENTIDVINIFENVTKKLEKSLK